MQPRDFAGVRTFRDASEAWPLLDDPDPTALAAAWLQFRVARHVWREIDEGRQSLLSAGDALGQSDENQRKKLAGEQAASVKDLLGWCILVGATAAVELQHDDSTYFPPIYRDRLAGWSSGRWSLPVLAQGSGPDWRVVATQLAEAEAERRPLGLDRLATADVLAMNVGAALIPRFLPAGAITREATATPGSVVLAAGATSPIWFGVADVRSDDVRSVADAAGEVRRIRGLIREIAEHGGGVVVLAYDDGVAATIDEATGSAVQRGASEVGPFEANAGDDWWGHHVVDVDSVIEARSGVHRVIVLRLLKAGTL